MPPWAFDQQVWTANQPMDTRAQQVMEEGWATQFDAASSLRAMDTEGIDVAVMFRTMASMFVSIDSLEPGYSLAICRAFNDWVADYCKEAPDRPQSYRDRPPARPGAGSPGGPPGGGGARGGGCGPAAHAHRGQAYPRP